MSSSKLSGLFHDSESESESEFESKEMEAAMGPGPRALGRGMSKSMRTGLLKRECVDSMSRVLEGPVDAVRIDMGMGSDVGRAGAFGELE